MEKKNSKKLKLYWSQSQLAWLVGTKPFTSKRIYIDRKTVEKLSLRLLKIGGTEVCIAFSEPLFISEAIIKHGIAFECESIKLVKGEPSSCHENTARLWKSGKNKYRLCTGYGLSDDQMWRRHSWLVNKTGEIIETTESRQVYFGIGHTPKAAEIFCKFAGVQ